MRYRVRHGHRKVFPDTKNDVWSVSIRNNNQNIGHDLESIVEATSTLHSVRIPNPSQRLPRCVPMPPARGNPRRFYLWQHNIS